MRSKSLTDLTGQAYERAKNILFSPFRFKVWLKLLLIAWLSGYLGGGCQGNFNSPGGGSNKSRSESADPAPPPPAAAKPYTYNDLVKDMKEMRSKAGLVALIAAVIAVPMFGLMVLFAWLCARFNFVFVEVISTGQVAVIEPFKRHREPARSYMVWLICFALAALAVVAVSLGAMGLGVLQMLSTTPTADIGDVLKDRIWAILAAGMMWILAFVGFMILCSIINLWGRDFVVPIMYQRRIGVLDAWRECLAMLRISVLEDVKYLFWRLLVNVATGIAIVIVWFVILIFVVIVGVVVALIGAGICAAVPALKAPLLLVGVTLAVLVMLTVILGMLLLEMPVAVWVRSFSLGYLESLDRGYRFFAPPPLPGAPAPGAAVN